MRYCCLMHETRMVALRRVGSWVERESTEGGGTMI